MTKEDKVSINSIKCQFSYQKVVREAVISFKEIHKHSTYYF